MDSSNLLGRPEALWTSEQTAKMLNISPRTLWTLTDEGVIPCIRLGRSVRYDPEEIRNWIKLQQKAVAAPETVLESP